MASVPRRRTPRKNGTPTPNGSNGSNGSIGPNGSNGHAGTPPPTPPGTPPDGGSGDGRGPGDGGPPPPRSPADELEALLHEPAEGAFLYGMGKRVYYPTLIEKITDTGERIVEVLREYDSPDLFLHYEALEFEVADVREHAAFSFGWQKGSADGRAEFLRSQAPHLSERAQRLADQARALVVTEGLSSTETTALLLETAWAVLLIPPAPSFER